MEPQDSAISICRSKIHELIQCRDNREVLDRVWIQLLCLPHVYGPALHSCLADGPGSDISASAGSLLYTLASRCSHLAVATQWRSDASEVIVASLKDAGEARSCACRLMVQGSVPAAVLSRLPELVRRADHRDAAPAAVILSRTGKRGARIVAVLEHGLDDERLDIADASAHALAGIADRFEDAERKLIAAVEAADRPRALAAVKAITHPGISASRAIPALKKVMADAAVNGTLRGFAGAQLGAIGSGSPDVVQALSDVFETDDPRMMEGIARGFRACRVYPRACVNLLVERLADPRPEMRLAALRCVEQFGEAAATCIPRLLELVQAGPSIEEMEALADALIACGRAAIEPVRSLLMTMTLDDVAMVPVLGLVLRGWESGAVAGLLCDLRAAAVRWGMSVVLAACRDMGPAAEAAVPLLGEILEQEEDEAVCEMALTAVHATGAAAKEALPGLLRCLLMGPAPLADRAERAIAAIGADAAPVLEQLLEVVAPDRRDRLNRLLADVAGTPDKRFTRFIRFNDDKVLQRFADVVSVLADQGPSSFDVIAKVLSRRGCPRVSANSLRAAVTTVELRFNKGKPLTTRSDGRKGALKPEAQVLEVEIRRYLDFKVRTAFKTT